MITSGWSPFNSPWGNNTIKNESNQWNELQGKGLVSILVLNYLSFQHKCWNTSNAQWKVLIKTSCGKTVCCILVRIQTDGGKGTQCFIYACCLDSSQVNELRISFWPNWVTFVTIWILTYLHNIYLIYVFVTCECVSLSLSSLHCWILNSYQLKTFLSITNLIWSKLSVCLELIAFKSSLFQIRKAPVFFTLLVKYLGESLPNWSPHR